jgi:hypothetical protein
VTGCRCVATHEAVGRSNQAAKIHEWEVEDANLERYFPLIGSAFSTDAA